MEREYTDPIRLRLFYERKNMKKETISNASGWLMQWYGRGATASVRSGDERLFLSLDGQPDVFIPRKYWRWLAAAMLETADKMEMEEL